MLFIQHTHTYMHLLINLMDDINYERNLKVSWDIELDIGQKICYGYTVSSNLAPWCFSDIIVLYSPPYDQLQFNNVL